MQIRVHVPSQTLELLNEAGTLFKRFPISTSKFGLGCEPGSQKTPTGRLRVESKWGADAPLGEIFVARVATGRIGHAEDQADHVQTRILWLEGLDPENANTHSRYIYIHGTNGERLLGTPASHGCVRMSNLDVAELFNLVEPGTPVLITETHEA
ncbi:MAG: Lipoprotein-anchoring transpeptidase ErfK/SrfK [Verrucomicrobia bacterium]|nr:MAG: Lipoprotein-anchoring transpeptidase ErfK/SrfK [Verrucomicrobiota bacterium]